MGFLIESDLNHLESFVRRAKIGGFLPDDAPSFRDMVASADSNRLGSIISNLNHVLRCLCKERPAIQYTKNFLSRMMLLDI